MSSTNDSPRFSIIIPCYNSRDYVRAAIESVLNQTYKNFELLLIDDGSKDDTLTILNDYASKDDRVKVFHKDNGGYTTAVNYGLDRIAGEYFLMMGSDDQLCLDLLENASRTVERAHPDAFSFGTRKHWVDGSQEDETDPSTKAEEEWDYLGSYRGLYEEHQYEADHFGVRDTGKAYKRELLGDLRYFGSTGIDADGIFALLFAHRCHSFSMLAAEGYVWSLSEGSVSARPRSASVHMDRLSSWIRFIKCVRKYPKKEMAGIDFAYALVGHRGIARKNKKLLFRHPLKFMRYYFLLVTFLLTKRGFKRAKKKVNA